MSLRRRKKRKATQTFTDREEFKESFWKNFNKYQSGEQDLRVLVFYGFGGIGKTALLKHLELLLKENISSSNYSGNFEVIDMNFSLSKSIDFIDFVNQLKNTIKVKYFPFDYAFLKLLDHRGINIERSKHTDNIIVNSVLNFLEGQFLIPSVIIETFIDKFKDFLNKQNFKNYIEEIDKMSPEELKETLSICLAEGLNEDFNKRYIFFIDSYENILTNKELDKSFENFVAHLDKGLFIISSREKLKWEEYDPRWSNYLEQHLLGQLGSNDARSFLKNNGIDDENIIDAIIKTSKCIPIYLDLCLDIYFNKVALQQRIEIKDFEKKENEIVDEFLEHLPIKFSESIKILSLFSFFDIEIFKNFVKDLNVISFREFVQLSGIEYVNNKKYKVHTILREFIKESVDVDIKRAIGKELLYYIEKEKNRYQSNEISELFTDALDLIVIKDREDILESEVESIISIGTYLIDRGYWNRVGDIAIRYYDKTLTRTKLNNALNFLRALYFRRTNDLISASRIYMNLDINELGKFKHTAKFHEINVIRLLGNYDKALEEYKRLRELVDKENNIHIKVSRQYADLLFLKGKFKESLDILENLLEKTSDKLEIAETLRIIGHIYKFNFLFDKALEYYNRAYKIAKEQNFIGLKGKLYTNFVEVYSFVDYEKATSFLEKSESLNHSLKAKLEIGKAYAFYSIANSVLKGNIQSAYEYSERALDIQKSIGYISGILFSLYSKLVLHLVNDDANEIIEEIGNKVKKLSSEIGVYKYLCLPYDIYSEGDLKKYLDIEWVCFDKVKDFYLTKVLHS